MFKRWMMLLLTSFILMSGVSFAETPFRDLSQSHWAFDAISALKEMQIISGYEDGNFKPDDYVTREEFAVMIAQAFNLRNDENALPTFSDVPLHKWSYKSIEAAKDYLTGYYPYGGSPFFQPELYTTREDVTVALIKSLNIQVDSYDGDQLESYFVDSEAFSRNMRAYVQKAIEEHLISGYEDQTFRPQNPITRAEVAVLIHKALKQANVAEEFVFVVMVDEEVSLNYIIVEGITHSDATVTLNNHSLTNDRGYFSCLYELSDGEGQYDIEIVSTLPDGRQKTHFSKVTYQIPDDYFEIDLLDVAEEEEQYLSGYFKDFDNDFIFTIDGERQSISGSGYWNKRVYLDKGENTFTFKLIDDLGREHVKVKNITFAPDPPSIDLEYVTDEVKQCDFKLNGYIKDGNDTRPVLYINNEKIATSNGGYFTKNIALEKGENEIHLVGLNKFGERIELTKVIEYVPEALDIQFVHPPETTTNNTYYLDWQVVSASKEDFRTYLNGNPVNPKGTVDIGKALTKPYAEKLTLVEGENEFTLSASTRHDTISKKVQIEFVPIKAEIMILSYEIVGNEIHYSIQVKDPYYSRIIAYLDDEKVTLKSTETINGGNTLFYYSLIVDRESDHTFKAINKYGLVSEKVIN